MSGGLSSFTSILDVAMAIIGEAFDDVIGRTETEGDEVTSDDTEGKTEGVTAATTVVLVED